MNTLIFILIFLLILLILYNCNVLETSYYIIKSNHIPDSFNNFKILQLSDLHSKQFGNHNKYLISKVKKENPDIIVMTGDMINTRDTNFNGFLELCSLLNNYEVYYVLGNHEENLENNLKELLLKNIKNSGTHLLNNKSTSITKNNNKINLYGLCFDKKYYKNPKKIKTTFGVHENINLLGNTSKNSFNILLAHNPLFFHTYANWGADLVLSGHIHGGIVRLPIIGGLLSPERNLFPKYSSGLYKINTSKLIVNRGLGNTKIKIRIFNRPEISVITLKNS